MCDSYKWGEMAWPVFVWLRVRISGCVTVHMAFVKDRKCLDLLISRFFSIRIVP